MQSHLLRYAGFEILASMRVSVCRGPRLHADARRFFRNLVSKIWFPKFGSIACSTMMISPRNPIEPRLVSGPSIAEGCNRHLEVSREGTRIAETPFKQKGDRQPAFNRPLLISFHLFRLGSGYPAY